MGKNRLSVPLASGSLRSCYAFAGMGEAILIANRHRGKYVFDHQCFLPRYIVHTYSPIITSLFIKLFVQPYISQVHKDDSHPSLKTKKFLHIIHYLNTLQHGNTCEKSSDQHSTSNLDVSGSARLARKSWLGRSRDCGILARSRLNIVLLLLLVVIIVVIVAV